MTKLTLVTGATGFVGRQVAKELAIRGNRVRAIVRKGSADHSFVTAHAGEIVETPDLFAESRSWWTEKCAGVDSVIHLAWYAEPGQYLNSMKNIDCLNGTIHLAQGASDAKVRRFCGIGTCFEYDLGTDPLTTDSPLKPTTVYSSSKAATYLVLASLLKQVNVSFAWCRLFYLYGTGEDERRLAAYLRTRLANNLPADLTSGTQVRDFMNVTDAARAIVDIASSYFEGPANICSGYPVTVREFAESIADEFGRRELLRFGARAENPMDPARVVGVPTRLNCQGIRP